MSSGNMQSNLMIVEIVGFFPKPLGSVKRFLQAFVESAMPFRLFTSNFMYGLFTCIGP